jgi:hypothetical protein
MRVKLLFACVLTLALAAAATNALAAPGGDPGKPEDPGRSSEAPGHNKDDAPPPSDSSKDPANPDGTYQGKSPSTPDQDGIGADHGIDNNDKTGPGTDGNNGCGNDPDREDDNNGWCGKKPAPEVSPTDTPTGSPTTPPNTVVPSPQAQVLGVKLVKPETEVLGLALTGAGLVIPIAMGSVLLMMGLGIRAIAKQPRL